jgi:hypothetical protein
VFWKGKWCDVELPSYVDPSWGATEQMKLALALLKGRVVGKTDDAVLKELEALIFRKEHCAPEDNEEKSGM